MGRGRRGATARLRRQRAARDPRDRVAPRIAVRVAIAGGSGQIAILLTRLLDDAGDEVLSLIRDPAKSDIVRGAGGEPVVCNLEEASEDEVADAVDGAEAVVFAAGAGPGSGPDRKWTMDHGGAV